MNRRTVTVAVLTFRRTELLTGLLPILVGQAARASTADTQVEIVVVDNDPDESARRCVSAVSAAWCSAEGPRLSYVHEPLPGIAAARNAALDAASGSDVIIFMDDDGEPADGWLSNLLSAFDRHAVSGVVGRMVPRYLAQPSRWILAGAFFDRPNRVTGTFVDAAPTNNLLLDLHDIRRAGLRFEPALGLIGGEDTLFTRQLTTAGCRVICCDEAVVVDNVLPERMNAGWVLLRRLRFGAVSVFVSLQLAGGPVERGVVRSGAAAKGAAGVAAGLAGMLIGAVTGSRPLQARSAASCAVGVGRLAGVAGLHYQEYGRADDRRFVRVTSSGRIVRQIRRRPAARPSDLEPRADGGGPGRPGRTPRHGALR